MGAEISHPDVWGRTGPRPAGAVGQTGRRKADYQVRPCLKIWSAASQLCTGLNRSFTSPEPQFPSSQLEDVLGDRIFA